MRIKLTPSKSNSSSSTSAKIKNDGKGVNISEGPPSYARATSQESNSGKRSPYGTVDPILHLSNDRSKQVEKNKPYRPDADLQTYIDALNAGSSSSTVPELTTYTSSTRTDYFDVLPSFQMFQSILKRDDNQFSEDLTHQPPEYGDTDHSRPAAPSNGHHGVSGNPNIASGPQIPEYALEREREESERQELLNLANEECTPSHSDPENEDLTYDTHDTHDTYGHTVLDNIDKLAVSRNSPIELEIHVTKKVPRPNFPNESEAKLKEYYTGDLVNGYIIISNTSDKPVDFGLFIVSLEGTIKAVERYPRKDSHEVPKVKRVLIKKFLKMYDLNASYGYEHIPNSAGIEYEAFSRDLHDGCFIGLPNERILQPLTKYKKFFTFRFPEKLLDDNCIDGVPLHIFPPPSFGIDTTSFFGRTQNISLNKAVGYGTLNVRGTPLLMKDYSFEDVSVSYAVEAKFIDQLGGSSLASDNEILSANTIINDPKSESKYIISKTAQFFLRFMPSCQMSLDYYNMGSSYGPNVNEYVGIDARFAFSFYGRCTWKLINERNYFLQREIENWYDRHELDGNAIKLKNLASLSVSTNCDTFQSNDTKDLVDFTHNAGSTLDEIQVLRDCRMIKGAGSGILGKKKKRLLASSVLIGRMEIKAKIPEEFFNFWEPKLVKRYNKSNHIHVPPSENALKAVSSASEFSEMTNNFSRLSAMNSTNDLRPISSLSNIDSDVDSLSYNENTQKIVLSFSAVENGIRPPEISQVEFNLVLWTFHSDFPLPLELDYDFFYSDYEKGLIAGLNDINVTRRNLQYVKNIANMYAGFVKDNNISITKESLLYLKAMKSLKAKKDTMRQFFRTISAANDPNLNDENSWSAKQDSKGKFQWTKTLDLPLYSTNKNNVTVIPTFQTCLVGRFYCLQILVKFKGSSLNPNDQGDNMVKVDVPILIA